ncbi:MAG: hypothetical protein ACK41D_00490 [Rubricoccaceae bacterium]
MTALLTWLLFGAFALLFHRALDRVLPIERVRGGRDPRTGRVYAACRCGCGCCSGGSAPEDSAGWSDGGGGD